MLFWLYGFKIHKPHYLGQSKLGWAKTWPTDRAETPEKSDRQIAAGLGVSHHTVGAQRKEMESTAEIPQLKMSIGADGKERLDKFSTERILHFVEGDRKGT